MLRFTLLAFLWLLSLLAVFWTLNLKDPHLLPWRAWESGLLLACCLLLAPLHLLQRRTSARLLGIGILLSCMLLVALGEYRLHLQKARVAHAQIERPEQLGAHLIVGYRQFEALRPLVSQGLVGGVFVTRRNLRGRSLAALQADIRQLQALRQAAGLPALLIAADQEGGLVAHLSPPLQQRPALATLEAADDSTLEQLAQDYGRAQGAELAALGVNLNFSPVVDLRQTHADNRLDFHTRISQRAISDDPQRTLRVARGYVRGLASQGVHATLKHFPGFAGVVGDTHHFSAHLGTPLETLRARDWLPFREIAGHSQALMMLGHVVLDELDPEQLVSTSEKLVQGVIRGEWQHQGVLISDDLSMAAAYNRGLCSVGVDALNAGVDLLLVSYDHEKIYPLLDCLDRARAAGRLDLQRLRESRARLDLLAR